MKVKSLYNEVKYEWQETESYLFKGIYNNM